MKKCPTCNTQKPVSAFHKNRSTHDGLATECRTCKIAYMRARQATGKTNERIRERRKTDTEFAERERAKCRSAYHLNKSKRVAYWRTEKGMAVRERYESSKKRQAWKKKYYSSAKFKEWRRAQMLKHRNHFKARFAVNNAVRDGRLPKTSGLSCKECSAPAAQYHHHKGYKPAHWLDVVPVCRNCHRKLDAQVSH